MRVRYFVRVNCNSYGSFRMIEASGPVIETLGVWRVNFPAFENIGSKETRVRSMSPMLDDDYTWLLYIWIGIM